MTHTRAWSDSGPDYCKECSAEVNEWVPWPCSPEALVKIARETAHRYCGEARHCEAKEAACPASRLKLGAAWSTVLDLMMEVRLDDGEPLLDVVLSVNPGLRRRLRELTE